MIFDFNSPLRKIKKKQVGGKFYNLFLLRSYLNSNIPTSFCITNPKFKINEIEARIHPSKKYAVRSSSNMEDQLDYSAAGMFMSFLNVSGISEITEKIKLCFDSADNQRVDDYFRKKLGKRIRPRLSVIVQDMIDAEKAGVLFTVNPVTGEEEFVIEYTEGLAEKLVDGQINPARIRIQKTELNTPDNFIGQLCLAGRKIEKYFNCPQDIEWAMRDGEVFILQARPHTIQVKERDLSEIWTRANIGEILPKPLTPLSWDIFSQVLFASYRFGFYGLHDRIIMNFIHLIPREMPKIKSPALFQGYAYLNLDTVRIAFSFEPWVDERILNLGLGFKFEDGEIKKNKKLSSKLISILKKIRFYIELLFPYLSFENRGIKRLNKQISEKFSGKSDFKSLLTKTSLIFGWHIAATAHCFSVLGYALRKIKTGESNLINSISTQYYERFMDQVRIIQGLVNNNKELSKKILEVNLTYFNEWEDFDDFREKFKTFLEDFGHRSENEFELRQKSWSTLPSLLTPLLVNYREPHITPDKGFLPKNINYKLLRSFRLREDLKDLLIKSYNDLKTLVNQEAEELVRNGIISETEDIYFLESNELEDKSYQNFVTIIRQRKAEFDVYSNTKTPYMFSGKDIPGEVDQIDFQENKVIKGLGCSKGRARGRAVFLDSPQKAELLKKGDILVAYSTDPGWTPLFHIASGVITEIGGLLSHTATIAREYEIPMITAVNGVTQKIKNGAYLEIDGSDGNIRILN